MGSTKVAIKMDMQLSEVIRYLEDIIAGLRDGKVVVQKGEQVAALTPSEPVAIEIAAKLKESKQKLAIEMTWMPAAEAAEAKELHITSQEPEPRELDPHGTAEA